jgi:transcription antitermination factor NusG
MLTWYVFRTRPQAEVRSRDRLREMGYTTFLAMEKRLRRTRKGKEAVEHPLVPSYLFAAVGPGQSLYDALAVDGVADVLRVGGNAHPIPAAFVYDLQARQMAGEFDHTPKARIWRKGDPARIIHGPFQGHIGKIVAAPVDGRATILLDGLFGGAPFRVAETDLDEAA